MAEENDDAGPASTWRQLNRERPWFRRFASQALIEARVESPTKTVYVVRVQRNSPFVRSELDGGDPLTAVLGLVKANVQTGGETGWRIEVTQPPSRWRSERVLYTQQVGARAIVIDVARVIVDALERGDTLWSEEDDWVR